VASLRRIELRFPD